MLNVQRNFFFSPLGKSTDLFRFRFIVSLRRSAACLGVNLIGAIRVIMMDVSWNPCHDAQAVCRVFRYGQEKHCYIYRLIADSTMEKGIYDRQVTKQNMSDRVLDELQPENRFTREEVENLLHLTVKRRAKREKSPLIEFRRFSDRKTNDFARESVRSNVGNVR